MLNDYELIYYCRMNNEEAFELLALKYHRLSYFIINRFVDKYEYIYYDVNELYNEALLILYNGIFSFRDEINDHSFKSYYTTCLNNHLCNKIRSSMALKRHNNDNISDLSLDYYQNDSAPLSQVIRDRRSDYIANINDYLYLKNQLNQFKQKLKPVEKEIFLAVMKGFSYEEVGSSFNMKRKQVEYIVSKCRARIKSQRG